MLIHRNNSGLIVGLIVCVLVFILTAVMMQQSGPGPIWADQVIQDWFLTIQTDDLTNTMLLLTKLGSSVVFVIVLVLAGAALIVKHRVPEALMLLIQLAVSWGFYKGLKSFFERPRPTIDHLVEASGYSFPSGNALMAAAFYAFAGMLLMRLFHRRLVIVLIMAVTIAAVLVAGFSRLYLSVHYASDIIAGYAVGGALFYGAALLLNRNNTLGLKKIRPLGTY